MHNASGDLTSGSFGAKSSEYCGRACICTHCELNPPWSLLISKEECNYGSSVTSGAEASQPNVSAVSEGSDKRIMNNMKPMPLTVGVIERQLDCTGAKNKCMWRASMRR